MKNKGFTLLEVLIASFVIVVGVIASYIMVQNIFAQTFDAAVRLEAIYLAKEGAELARNIRDTAWIQDLAWANNGLNIGYSQMDYDDNGLSSCSSCSGSDNDFNALSFFKEGNPFYRYSGTGTNTRFKRRIRIERPTAESIRVTVDVFWQRRGDLKKVTIQSYLYDWRDRI